jgi:crotonobetainyl-CoA:carnitine CoA-transferase CaiB-like acyl-CoA transferase
MVSALTHSLAKAPDWDSVERWVRTVPADDVVARGLLLGLAISRPGEAEGTGPGDMLVRMAGSRVRNGARLKVVDLSRLWAGPLCGRMFADMGADVIKVDTGTETAGSNEFDASLNSHKRRLRCDFDLAYGSELSELVSQADVLITSGRSRSFAQAGMLPEDLLGMRPGFVWIAITAHGWRGCGADRIGFGDDAAVAGGLVDWKADGTPAFLGDALADPLTGLVAALAGLDALQRGGGYFADVSMSGTAAWVAARMASQDNAF